MSMIESMIAEIDAKLAAEKAARAEIARLTAELESVKAQYSRDFGMYSRLSFEKASRAGLVAIKTAIDGGAESVELMTTRGAMPAAMVKRTAARVCLLTVEGEWEFDARTGEGRGAARGYRIPV